MPARRQQARHHRRVADSSVEAVPGMNLENSHFSEEPVSAATPRCSLSPPCPRCPAANGANARKTPACCGPIQSRATTPQPGRRGSQPWCRPQVLACAELLGRSLIFSCRKLPKPLCRVDSAPSQTENQSKNSNAATPDSHRAHDRAYLTSILGSPNVDRGDDLPIFPGIGTYSSGWLHLNA